MGKGRILIVEDESIVALGIRSTLMRLGYEVVGVASTGLQALSLAEAARPDLVLMDVMLDGGMDGIDTARELHEHLRLPVVYLSAATDEKTLDRAKRTDPFGYITKPFRDHDLSLAIEVALYKARTDAQLQESERLLSTTLGSLAEAVVAIDAEGRVTYMNPAASHMLGVEAEQPLGHDISALFTIMEPDTRLPIAGLEEICSPSAAHPMCEDMLLRTSAGLEMPVGLSVSPVTGQRGEFRGRVMVLRNVALRKQAEAELLESMQALRTAFRQTVRALASMAEKRDPYTAGHQQRVARLACAIGGEMGLPADSLEGLEVSGTLHDVGKVYVPAEILSKPARLSHMEMGIMKSHSEVGFEILREVNFPWPVARTVLEHHERLDGSGYPGGLKGTEISLEARILAVADVVEAMSSHRPYRAALGLPLALEEIKAGRGKVYDPEVVDACLALLNRGGFTFEAPEPHPPGPLPDFSLSCAPQAPQAVADLEE
ncbi:MAG: response regulator [Humidesulfovibrio sp.]|uniref:HD domain-containing phosphohydrolase n=1 Tax=Humidesulfovibrio sp. TaxID=2910988 RepID=UPI0027E99327|nr:HD domain-containing phosphohydrolase [Humidesulfovibrio sp.]MDQ7836002.1 response regulator [Humidesulfovibrio sp.]